MIEDKLWVYFGNGNKVNNSYWHTWHWQRPPKLNNNNQDVQTFTNLPKWVDRGCQVRNGEWILWMKINDTIILLNRSPQMHLKIYLSRNLRQSTNFSSGSSCTQIAWRSRLFFINSTLPDLPHLRKLWLQSTSASVPDKLLDYTKVVKTVLSFNCEWLS